MQFDASRCGSVIARNVSLSIEHRNSNARVNQVFLRNRDRTTFFSMICGREIKKVSYPWISRHLAARTRDLSRGLETGIGNTGRLTGREKKRKFMHAFFVPLIARRGRG